MPLIVTGETSTDEIAVEIQLLRIAVKRLPEQSNVRDKLNLRIDDLVRLYLAAKRRGDTPPT